jgi:hypothetical protein
MQNQNSTDTITRRLQEAKQSKEFYPRASCSRSGGDGEAEQSGAGKPHKPNCQTLPKARKHPTHCFFPFSSPSLAMFSKFTFKFYYTEKKDSTSHQNIGTCMEY